MTPLQCWLIAFRLLLEDARDELDVVVATIVATEAA